MENNKCWPGCGEIGNLVHYWWECRIVQLLRKTVCLLLKKLKIELPYNPVILFYLYICKIIESRDSNRYLYTSVYSSIIHTSQKVKITQMSINRWVDKQDVVYTYKRISFSLIKEWYSDSCYNMAEPWKHTKWNKPITKGQILYDSIYKRYLE